MLAEANRRLTGGDASGAAGIYASLLKQQPTNPQLLYFLGTCQRAMGRLAEAQRTLEKALKLRPHDAGCLYDLALIHKRQGRFHDAHRVFDLALRNNSDNQTVRAGKADLFFFTGDFKAAENLLLPVIESGSVQVSLAISFAQLAPRIGRERQAVDVLTRLLAHPHVPPAARTDALFKLGELHDKLKEWDQAFECYRAANGAKSMPFDPRAFSEHVDLMLRAWTPSTLAMLPRAPGATDRPIFIVGMPRSGTTLVEQILSSHPNVFGAGELNDMSNIVHDVEGDLGAVMSLLTDTSSLTPQVVDRRSRQYLEALRRLNRVAPRVTDKAPLNCLHLGFISLILPHAKIIHCIRDPVDTCLSIFFQHFGGGLPFAYNLAHIGSMYRDYHRIMRHWREGLGLPVLDVVYEELVADQEGGTRRMLEHLGLPWNDACLQFHKSERVAMTVSNDQVRRPIYKTSVQRWRHYAKHLEPLFAALGDLAPQADAGTVGSQRAAVP